MVLTGPRAGGHTRQVPVHRRRLLPRVPVYSTSVSTLLDRHQLQLSTLMLQHQAKRFAIIRQLTHFHNDFVRSHW